MRPLRLIVVDDHEAVAASFVHALGTCPDLRVLAAASCVDSAVELLRRHRPDVAVVDLLLGEARATARFDELRAASPGTALLVVTGWPSVHDLEEAFSAGASGFLSKARTLDELADAVRRTASGEVVVDPSLVGELAALASASRGARLDLDDLRMLRLLADGGSTEEVAERCYWSPHTVRARIAAVEATLGASSRVEAVREAERRGLISPTPPAALAR